MFPSLSRRSLSLGPVPLPVDLSDASLLEALRAFCTELVLAFSDDDVTPFFQRRNFRSLVRKIQVISVILDCFGDVRCLKMNTTRFLCLKELYVFLHRVKILHDYLKGSSKLWLLLQSHSISAHFHDLNQEISTLLDVFPIRECNVSEDVIEQAELLRKQSRKSRWVVDEHDDLLRSNIYHFLNEFEEGRVPHSNDLYSFFVEELVIRDVESCSFELEFLEDQIMNHDGDTEPTLSVLSGFVALIRYCRFLLFRFDDEEGELGKWKYGKTKRSLISTVISEAFTTIPKDFVCPISLEMMKDPMVISTGQTYDHESISRWMEEGHCTCPQTRQMLVHTRLVRNEALRNMIRRWCMANDIPYDPLVNAASTSESAVPASWSRAVAEATKATAGLLVEQLANGAPRAKTVAAMKIRLLAKTGRETRACLAEAGAIPLLKMLLSSSDSLAQENSITALLNLSIYDKNKSRIMDVEGCLGSIVEVLRFGHTIDARENAAATLFSLSAVHEFKKQIAQEQDSIESLAGLLRNGTPRGKKDAVTALFNLSTHTENCTRMIGSGAVAVLVNALRSEGVFEEATGALALIVRQPIGAEAVGNEEMAVDGLVEVMRCGTAKGKENAVVVLLELCRGGGASAREKVMNTPSLANLLQSLLFTGTKRARRKAASLARVFQRSKNQSMHFGGLGMAYTFSGSSTAARDTMPVSITVPV